MAVGASSKAAVSAGIRINQLIDLAVEVGDGVKLYRTRIEDLDGDAITVAFPRESQELSDAARGRLVALIARDDLGIRILGATVADRRFDAVPLLVLRLTGDLESMQRRRAVRLTDNLDDVRVRLETADGLWSSVGMLNISAGGLLFRAQGHMALSRHLRLRLELPGSPCFETNATVVRLASEGRGGSMVTAVRFAGLNENHRDRIFRYILHRQASRRAAEKQRASILRQTSDG